MKMKNACTFFALLCLFLLIIFLSACGSRSGGEDPVVPPAGSSTANRNGMAVYSEECAACHAMGSFDPDGSLDLASQGAAIVLKIGGGHMNKILSSAELNALADFADSFTPPGPPALARSGQEIYDGVCAGCHLLDGYDSAGTIDLAGQGSIAGGKVGGGHGGAVSAEELSGLSTWLDTFTSPADPAGNCTACHGQPPEGSLFPDTAGAHQAHAALPGVGSDCAVCHTGATHNDWVDLAFPATWEAKSGAATDNMDGTCSGIRCHGGVQTPDWASGSIQVDTQCKACHVSGTTEDNGYWSGQHRRHVTNENYDCLDCHDAGKLAAGHFSNLATPLFEQAPGDTIKSSLGYTGTSCATPGTGCHGRKSW